MVRQPRHAGLPVRESRPNRWLLITILALIIAVGCSDDGLVLAPTPPRPKYPVPSTPQAALLGLAQAYQARDSVEYPKHFDAAYQGTSTDLTQPPGFQVLNFTKADEIAHIGALARASTVTYVSPQLGPSLVRYTDSADPVGWATIDIVFSLQIDGFSNSYYVDHTAQTFKFVPTTPATNSPSDTTWTIIRWTELKQ